MFLIEVGTTSKKYKIRKNQFLTNNLFDSFLLFLYFLIVFFRIFMVWGQKNI